VIQRHRFESGGALTLDARDSLNPVTPLNLVSASDIGGGDYGSVAVNQRGELVGVTKDITPILTSSFLLSLGALPLGFALIALGSDQHGVHATE
jgi:hypothetical protein